MSVTVTSLQREAYTRVNEQKSDGDLQLYILNIAKKVQSIPANASPALMMQAQELLAESQVCAEILENRKRQNDALAKAHEKWESMQSERRYNAVKNLKNAVTPIGQLVAAILEDEGSLGEREIATWCDELEVLDDNDLHGLLSSLVTEGVLSLQGDSYSLVMPCTESLLPDNPVEWAKAKLGGCTEDQEVLLRLIRSIGIAICPEDFPNILTSKKHALPSVVNAMWGGYPKEYRMNKIKELSEKFKDRMMVEMILCELPLSPVSVNGFIMYYYPMLGEGGQI